MIETVILIVTFFGGVAMFLYGAQLMSEGFQKSSGAKLERTLEKFSNRVWKGALMGAAVTAVIQSSSATTVTVVGFVNSGIMSLIQATGVIMGANIGTTVTAQIISLGDIFSLFKPEVLGPIALTIGIIIFMAVSSKKSKSISSIFLGFGFLFVGMNLMSGVFKEIDNSVFEQIFTTFSQNPLLGILAGTVITAIIQSSSASVGILQAAASSGGITFGAAVPVILGQNIGTCITAILSSIGATKNAKRAAMIHLYFNIIGTVVFCAGTYAFQSFIPIWNDPVNKQGIAMFHTIFNIGNTLLLLPFSKLLVKLAELTIKSKEEKKADDLFFKLEERFLKTPTLAVEQCVSRVNRMGELAKENFDISKTMISKYDKRLLEKFRENENSLDRLESVLENYILKLTSESLTVEENKAVSGLLHAINDFERMGDYSENIIEATENMAEEKLSFTPSARKELLTMADAVDKAIDITCTCYKNSDVALARKVEPIEEVIDMMKETLKARHITRLKDGQCNVQSGIAFLDIINNFERIGDHCSSVAVTVMHLNDKEKGIEFDPHEYLDELHRGGDAEFRNDFENYRKTYFEKIAE